MPGRCKPLAERGAAAVAVVVGLALALDRSNRGHHLMKVSQHFAPKIACLARALCCVVARLQYVSCAVCTADRDGAGEQ